MSGLTYHLRAAFTPMALALSLVCWTVPAHLPPLLRKLLPYKGWKKFWTDIADRILSGWVGFIAYGTRMLLGIRWNIRGAVELSTERWYFVNANQ